MLAVLLSVAAVMTNVQCRLIPASHPRTNLGQLKYVKCKTLRFAPNIIHVHPNSIHVKKLFKFFLVFESSAQESSLTPAVPRPCPSPNHLKVRVQQNVDWSLSLSLES